MVVWCGLTCFIDKQYLSSDNSNNNTSRLSRPLGTDPDDRHYLYCKLIPYYYIRSFIYLILALVLTYDCEIN